MKKSFIFYVDMDGVLNHFEQDTNARINMWTPGYFRKIPVRAGINEVLKRINQECYVVILSKVINRIGVTSEKIDWIRENLDPEAYSDVIFVPYDRSKADYMYSYYPSILLDDNESNLVECSKKGSYGIFISDLKISQKFITAKSVGDILDIYKRRLEQLGGEYYDLNGVS